MYHTIVHNDENIDGFSKFFHYIFDETDEHFQIFKNQYVRAISLLYLR